MLVDTVVLLLLLLLVLVPILLLVPWLVVLVVLLLVAFSGIQRGVFSRLVGLIQTNLYVGVDWR